jgi:hypothetical protein
MNFERKLDELIAESIEKDCSWADIVRALELKAMVMRGTIGAENEGDATEIESACSLDRLTR